MTGVEAKTKYVFLTRRGSYNRPPQFENTSLPTHCAPPLLSFHCFLLLLKKGRNPLPRFFLPLSGLSSISKVNTASH